MVDLAGGDVGPKEVKQQLAHWDEDRGTVVVITTSTFFAIAFITVILRLAARWKQRLRLQWDDYLIVAALVSPLRSPSNARLISSRFWILVFLQRHCFGGPTSDRNVFG